MHRLALCLVVFCWHRQMIPMYLRVTALAMGHHIIVPVPGKQPQIIWINNHPHFTNSGKMTRTIQTTPKQIAYLVCPCISWKWIILCKLINTVLTLSNMSHFHNVHIISIICKKYTFIHVYTWACLVNNSIHKSCQVNIHRSSFYPVYLHSSLAVFTPCGFKEFFLITALGNVSTLAQLTNWKRYQLKIECKFLGIKWLCLYKCTGV